MSDYCRHNNKPEYCPECNPDCMDQFISEPGEVDPDRGHEGALKAHGVDVLYHITAIENLPSILEKGLLPRRVLKKRDIGYKDVSLDSAQDRRTKFHWSVPLYINPRNPTMYHIIEKQRRLDEVCLLRVDPMVANQPDTRFADGNVASKYTTVERSPSILESFNWEVLNGGYDPGSKRERRQRCAEVLIHRKVPSRWIEGVIVGSRTARDRVSDLDLDLELELEPSYFRGA